MTDRVTQAARAVRHTTSGEESGAACFTRARVLAAVRQRRRRRVLNFSFGIPLAAILTGSLAWAASGQNLTHLVHYLSATLKSGDAEPVPQAVARKPTARRAPPVASHPHPPASTPPSSLEAATIEPTRTAAPPAEQGATQTSSAAHVSRAASGPAGAELTERELHLYEVAHHAHFFDKNWSAALAAWQAYLRSHPRGRFSQEAEYNRALCLVRLGRTDQALSALRPFARGSAGNYRQREARELVERIERDALEPSRAGSE